MIESHFTTSNSSNAFKSYHKELFSYNHNNSASIGYDSASLQLNVNKLDMFELSNFLIGSYVEVFMSDSDLVWEGFVNEVAINYGQTQITFGPMLEVVNRVLVKYTDYSTGVPGVTTYASDSESISKYGLTLTRVLNAGSISSTNAIKIRDRYLFENKYHKTNKQISSSSQVSFNVNCLGLYHLLGTYIYNTPSPSTIGASTKIKNVLAAQPNSIYYEDYSDILTNSLSVLNLENQDRTAADIIKDVINLGYNAVDDRMIFGILGKKAYYRLVDYNTKYYVEGNSKNLSITNIVGDNIPPWKIKPGYFIEFLGDIPHQTSNRFNQRTSLIESVSYTYPYGFQLSSGEFGTLPQQLAKLGISGL